MGQGNRIWVRATDLNQRKAGDMPRCEGDGRGDLFNWLYLGDKRAMIGSH